VFTIYRECSCFIFQLFLATVNLTTNESINWPRYKHMKNKEGKLANPYQKNWKINLLEFFHIIPLPKDVLEAEDDNDTM